MTKKEYCLSHDHIAYYSGVGGVEIHGVEGDYIYCCLLYTSPSPRDI